MQDPAIKLFGKKIPLSLVGNSPPISRDEDVVMNSIEKAPGKDSNRETEQDPSEETPATNEPEDEDQQKETNPDVSSDSVDPKTPSIDEDTATGKASKAAKDQIDSPDSSPEKEKALKKPDKILPCPRCNSMDTKFCYYNNYNVNQPRHFCKACQRYWTAGGTMRNVPVGAGRRKSKSSSSASRYRHLNIPEAFQVTHGVNHHHHHHQYPDPRTHGTVLSFGSDSCDHMTVNQKNGEDCSSESTVTTILPPVDELGTKNLQNLNGLNVPTFPWPYNMAVPFYPGPAFWTCNIPTPWNIPCLSSPSQNPQGFGPNSQVLGKHLREGDGLESDRWKKNGSVLIPKTLRIDDPSEAAKSSIWATLGIKNEGIAKKGGIFTAFKPMFEEKTRVPEPQNPAIICANPAALSRSLKFHESH